MASITRDRGCCYYVPWIPTFCVCLAIASLGVWAWYTRECRSDTIDALKYLDISAKNLDRINPALVATAITYLVLALIIYLLSLWRSFVEAAHDATGVPARGSVAFLALAFLASAGWWAVCGWLVLLLMGNTVWAAVLYVTREAIAGAQTDIVTHGSAVWLPSSGLPCPGQCLDLTVFVFISSELQDACICDTDKLATAKAAFGRAYDKVPGVAVGNWVMLIAGGCLAINFACQFAHTKREREMLLRVGSKRYSGV